MLIRSADEWLLWAVSGRKKMALPSILCSLLGHRLIHLFHCDMCTCTESVIVLSETTNSNIVSF